MKFTLNTGLIIPILYNKISKSEQGPKFTSTMQLNEGGWPFYNCGTTGEYNIFIVRTYFVNLWNHTEITRYHIHVDNSGGGCRAELPVLSIILYTLFVCRTNVS